MSWLRNGGDGGGGCGDGCGGGCGGGSSFTAVEGTRIFWNKKNGVMGKELSKKTSHGERGRLHENRVMFQRVMSL